jgi:hypothetical protein
MTINPSAHKPDHLRAIPQADPEAAAKAAWLEKARNLHRTKRLIGFAGAVLGAGFVLWWRYSTEAPSWAEPGGFTIVGLSIALILFSMADRYIWVKRNPYRSPPRP